MLESLAVPYSKAAAMIRSTMNFIVALCRWSFGGYSQRLQRNLTPVPLARSRVNSPRSQHSLHDGNGASRNRSEEHTSELQSQSNLVCRLLLEKKKKKICKHRNAILLRESLVYSYNFCY